MAVQKTETASASGNATFGPHSFPSVTISDTGSFTATDLADYTGTGNASLGFIASDLRASGESSAPANTLFFGGNETAKASATVTYTYSTGTDTNPSMAVPEPADIAVFAVGLLGLCLVMYRRSV